MRQGVSAVREGDLHRSLQAFRNLPVGVAVWQLHDLHDVRSLRFVGSNQAAERELRAPVKFAVGKPIAECFPKLLDTDVPEFCRRAVLTGKPDTLGEVAYRDAHIPPGIFWMDCFPLPERCAGIALENITERKQLIENQKLALQLLHRATLFLNGAPTVVAAAQFCVDEICTQIGWPVGRFFLSHEVSPSCFLPSQVWHFSDTHRFKAFRKATELYELDLTNMLALEYRTMHGQKAGLKRSVGFSVVENDFLRGVLEFSSEDLTPLDEHIFRAISNIGYQLGHVFARERLAREHRSVQQPMVSRDVHDAMSIVPFSGKPSLSAAVDLPDAQSRTRLAIRTSSKELANATRQMREHFEEFKRLTAKPVELASIVEF